MQSSRKGLKRAGLRSYAVTGPRGTWIIERENSSRFAVRSEGWPRAPGGKGRNQGVFFQVEPFRRLIDARRYAEKECGLHWVVYCDGKFFRAFKTRREAREERLTYMTHDFIGHKWFIHKRS